MPFPRNISTSKLRNIKTEVDGIKFDSKKEAKRWGDLKLLERAGIITDLRRQVTYELKVNDMLICKYVADFVYIQAGKLIVEDVKGFKTPEYNLKKKLMKAIRNIEIKEM